MINKQIDLGDKHWRTRRFSAFLCVFFIVALFAVNVMGSDSPGQQEGKTFTNKDLETYKNPSDNPTWAPKAEKKEDKNDGLKKLHEEFERERWCKKATVLNRKIEKAQDEVEDKEEKVADLKKEHSGADSKRQPAYAKRLKRLEKDLEKSHKKVKYAQKDLADLEEEARRKGVLPGWLRCQQ